MGGIMNLIGILGMAKNNPQQAVMNLLQAGLQNGRINQQQYNLLMGQLQNGANPNMIIQQQYEDARQNAQNFK